MHNSLLQAVLFHDHGRSISTDLRKTHHLCYIKPQTQHSIPTSLLGFRNQPLHSLVPTAVQESSEVDELSTDNALDDGNNVGTPITWSHAETENHTEFADDAVTS
jgi:hypothetical protein